MNARSWNIRALLPAPGEIVFDLQSLTREDYERAIAEYIDRMQGIQGVSCIAQFGSVRTPGVSDLDLLLICSDTCLVDVTLSSQNAVQVIANGRYLFWHPAMVVPVSLLQVVNMFYPLEDFRVLWGDPRPLTTMPPVASELRTLTSIIWNSFFWRIVMSLRKESQGLRTLLLVLNNIAYSVANDIRIARQVDHSTERDWSENARATVLAAPSEHKSELAIRFLADAIEQWRAADLELDAWWQSQQLTSLPRGLGSLRLNRGQKIVFCDRQDRTNRFLDKILAQAGMLLCLELPPMYLEVISLIQAGYAPRVEKPFSDGDTIRRQSSLTAPWQDAIRELRTTITAAREFARDTSAGEWSIFENTLCVPFML